MFVVLHIAFWTLGPAEAVALIPGDWNTTW